MLDHSPFRQDTFSCRFNPEFVVAEKKNSEDLLKAIRRGDLDDVRELLASGIPAEFDDGQGVPGLPLGIACFMGQAAIVRELVAHGAKVNLPDNREPVSPLAMALRGQHGEVVRLLIELGAEPAPGMACGLSEHELTAARWQAYRDGFRSTPPADDQGILPEIEEIVMSRPFGIDTTVLEADVIRAAQEMEAKKKAGK